MSECHAQTLQFIMRLPTLPFGVVHDVIGRLQHKAHKLSHFKGVVGELGVVPEGWMVTLREVVENRVYIKSIGKWKFESKGTCITWTNSVFCTLSNVDKSLRGMELFVRSYLLHAKVPRSKWLVQEFPLPCPAGTLCPFSAKSRIERPAVEPNLDSSSHPDNYIWEGQMQTLYLSLCLTFTLSCSL